MDYITRTRRDPRNELLKWTLTEILTYLMNTWIIFFFWGKWEMGHWWLIICSVIMNTQSITVIAYDRVQVEGKVMGDQVIQFLWHIYWITQSFFTDWNGLLYHKLNSFIYWGLFLGYFVPFIWMNLTRSLYFIDPLCELRTQHWFIVITASASIVLTLPGPVLSALCVLPHFVFTATLWRKAADPCSADRKWGTEKLNHWHQVPQPESRGSGFEFRESGFRVCAPKDYATLPLTMRQWGPFFWRLKKI